MAAVATGALGGCAASDGGGGSPVGADTAAISGGVPDPGFDAVVYILNLADRSACTGSIVSPRLVLTAKHCVNDGTGQPAMPSEMRVYVGPSSSMPTAVYFVAEVKVVPGPWDVSSGDDVAGLILAQDADLQGTPITPIPISYGGPLGLVAGTTVTAIGYGDTPSGTSGVKMTAQTTVSSVDTHFVHVQPAICPGDSGGPLLYMGEVWGVASYILTSGPGTCGFPGAYTALGPFQSDVQGWLTESMTCSAPTQTDPCNGLDDNCNGIVDEGCKPLGQPCTAGNQCVGGNCGDTSQGMICSQKCDPMQPDVGCPPGMYCGMSPSCEGWCVPGYQVPDPKLLGQPCTSDTECVSMFCRDPGDGVQRCLQPCLADAGACLAGEACAATNGCGGCVSADLVPPPRGLGEPCGSDSDCTSGICLNDQSLRYCTTACSADVDCASGYHCRAASGTTGNVCIKGPRQDVGGACVTTGDCATGDVCASASGASWCTKTCTPGSCPLGFECSYKTQPPVCAPTKALVGESCTTNADCISGLCAKTSSGSVCTRTCGPEQLCAPGLECVRVDQKGTAVCLPGPSPGGGGCDIAGGAGGRRSAGVGWLLLMFGLLVGGLRKRRWWLAACMALAVTSVLSGCSDLSEFKTGPNTVYEGRVLGVDMPDAGVSFIRWGFQEGTVMTLTFDPSQADSRMAGQITTNDTAAPTCGGPTFNATELRAISPLLHDSLSQYDFPGTGRIQNYIFAAQPAAGPLAGRNVSVYMSLLRGGEIDVRVVSGFGQPTCGPCDCFFGVFRLNKTTVP